jgi:uridine phosphorylase
MTDATLYLRCRLGDVAPLVLLSGDPSRVDRTGHLLDNARPVSSNREFSVVTGACQGAQVTVASGGIGAPSTAIAVQELAMLGAKAIVRIGTNMGIHAPLGTVVLSTGAARFEGTSERYLPNGYPATPDWTLVQALAESGKAADLDVRLGITATHDAFYPDMAASLTGDGFLDLSMHRRAGVLSMDMETSLLFVMGAALGVATAAMCLITVLAEPHTHLDLDTRAELDTHMVRAALDGLVTFGSTLKVL